MALVRGYETRVVAALATELVARASEASEIAAIEVEITLKRSATPHSDTGEMRESVSVDTYGGLRLGGFGASEVGIIAKADAEHAEWVDKGVPGTIAAGASGFLPVGKRAPFRRNAPAAFKGVVTKLPSVSGQDATGWFSRPFGRPLNELMREQFRRAFRRLR